MQRLANRGRLLLPAIIILLSGCSSAILGMLPATTSSASLSPTHEGEATLLISRPTGTYWKESWVIVDADAHFVATLESHTYAMVTVQAGSHTFYVINRGGGAAMVADVAAGSIYIMQVDAAPAAAGGYQTTVLPVRSSDPASRHRVQTMLNDHTLLIPSGGSDGETWVRDRRASVVQRMTSARDRWTAFSEEEKAALRLDSTDGFQSLALEGTQGFELSESHIDVDHGVGAL